MNFLLDTCVISDFTQKTPSHALMDWLATKEEDTLFLSVLTLGELQQGISHLADCKRKLDLQRWLDQSVTARFARRILPIDAAITDRWGRLRGAGQQVGRNYPVIDSLLAATALAHGMTLVTRNVRDFEGMELPLRNPWDDYA